MPDALKDKIAELTDKTELEIDKVTQDELAEREPGVPSYKDQCNYAEDQVIRLSKEIFDAYDRLKKEKEGEKLPEKWDSLEAQYKGEMADDSGLEFNLDVPITQVKCDAIERLSVKALTESDPKFTVTPRPEMAKMDKWDVTVTRQADYLDYKLDEEINVVSPLRKVLHQATMLGLGILKVPYEYMKKRRRREEYYSAKQEVEQQSGQVRIPGLEAFLRAYPEAIQPGSEGHWVINQLMSGKDVTFKSTYYDVAYDDPKPAFVDIKDFFVDKNTEGYEGLCDAHLTIERQRGWTWWELKKAESNGDFDNVGKCKNVQQQGEDENDEDKAGDNDEGGNYKTRKYTVLECVYHFNEADSDNPDDEQKIVCWFEAKSKAFLGAIYYPYDIVECYYIPFYIKDKMPGFWKEGIAEDLTSSHLAQNAVLNFMLTEAWQQLMTTPILKEGSPIADQFLNKTWKPGIPLTVPTTTMDVRSELGFLDKPQKAVAQQMMPILMFLAKYDDDRTGVSSLATGKESPTDPTAPAAKTAMLLQQSGINISDYINCLVPSFNKLGEIILGLTYQMTQRGSGRAYKQRTLQQKVTGGEIFEQISREDMIAKTNIQSRAAGFDFDKMNEKRENLALFQVMLPFLTSMPIFSQNIDGIYTLARTLVQSWSPLWKNKVDELLPNPQEIQQSTVKIAMQGLQVYAQQLQAQKQAGLAGEPKLEEFIQTVGSLMTQAVNPPEEQK